MSEKKEERNNSASLVAKNFQDIKKAGILRKLKTMKKKYFILRTESDSGPARLEYYDNEKKFRAGGTAKRSIHIKTCFNINHKIDAKHKFAIALYTKDDCFSVVADSDASLEEWLDAMLELQLDGPCLTGGAKLKPKFEHIWQVTVGDKSLAVSRNMKGLYRLCLTSSSLALVKVDQSDSPETLEFSLMSIRRCGHTNNYFVIELGRSSITGAGELWLETEDVVIAQNMHEVTLNAMKSCREHEDFGSFSRPRSASNSENSRPTTRPRPVAVVSPQAYAGIRDRCDSLPSRPRTISEGQESNNRSYYAQPSYVDSLRPYSGFPRTLSYSPPTIPNALSPVSATCSTDSAGSSLSIEDFETGQQADFALGRYIHNLPTDGALHTEPPIKEEQLDEYVPMSIGNTNSSMEGYLTMGPVSASAPTCPSIFMHLNSTPSTDYMDMKSPIVEGYISMSPLGAQLDSNATSVDPNAGHRKDGYIPMAPVHDHHHLNQNEGYLDMAPLSSSLPVSGSPHMNVLSSKDSFSKISDTVASSPSSTNLEDFPLDKVKSLLADTDEASFDSYIRPVRAYSMGSRPQPKKTHLSLQVDGSRIRAYSVGSQNQRKGHQAPERDIGNLMKTDARTYAKSSSAPLLNNKLRSSASRGEVGEDLMEIDYNKSKYSSGSMDCHAFTIEPVGRSRSGSYSSSSNLVKRIYDRDSKPQTIAGSCVDNSSDYLSMSPVFSRAKESGMPILSNSCLYPKKAEPAYPPGDYVSLDPSCTYKAGEKLLQPATTANSIDMSIKSKECRSQSYVGPTLSRVNSCTEDTANSSVTISDVTRTNEANKSDYMCMNFERPLKCHSGLAEKEHSPQEETSKSSFPSIGPHPSAQGSPFVQCLSQQSNCAPTTNSNGGEIRLNYASLDLPPPSEEDGKKLKKVPSEEETPPTYAQIDFSPVRQKAFQESESLSHL